MLVAVPRESHPGEARVALVPDLVKKLKAAGAEVAVQAGAGEASGFGDALYAAEGAQVEPDAGALLARADLVLKVRAPTDDEVLRMREGAALVCLLEPRTHPERAAALDRRRITAFALDLMPRTSRAQSMDVLSSQSSAAGYRAVIEAAHLLPKMFPLMVTAAGTVTPARVLVIGAGVAGLQAIATARRLGAVVEAYDIRPAVKEEVQSLGAKFLEIKLEAADAQDAGGYARGQDESFLRKQAELLAGAVAASDVVITTAAVPGKRAPLLVSAEAVARMRPGSVVFDLAAEQGGNCALTQPGRTAEAHGVTICGPLNLAAEVPRDASRMFAHNAVSFLLHVLKDGRLRDDPSDDIMRATLVAGARGAPPSAGVA
jgi:NAD(P) transhydrogenase subunit alpha